MDREPLFGVLALVFCGPALWAGALIRQAPARARSARELERLRWLQLWRGTVPASLVFALLIGWALREPDDAEVAPLIALTAAVPFAVVWGRALLRAGRSFLARPPVETAATVGLLAPRVVVAPHFAASLDAAALAAALKHEAAHARHRDPLRLWLAQLATDLMWPVPVERRLTAWRTALELARDEEARLDGADGADLAEAVIAGLRQRGERSPPPAVASLTGEEVALRQRVRRLLRPVRSCEARRRGLPWLIPIAFGLISTTLGVAFGEAMVRGLLGGGP